MAWGTKLKFSRSITEGDQTDPDFNSGKGAEVNKETQCVFYLWNRRPALSYELLGE